MIICKFISPFCLIFFSCEFVLVNLFVASKNFAKLICAVFVIINLLKSEVKVKWSWNSCTCKLQWKSVNSLLTFYDINQLIFFSVSVRYENSFSKVFFVVFYWGWLCVSFFWSSTINKICDLWPAMYIQLIMLHLFLCLIFDLTPVRYPTPT